jgi:hemoglobin-like flavoprotein
VENNQAFLRHPLRKHSERTVSQASVSCRADHCDSTRTDFKSVLRARGDRAHPMQVKEDLMMQPGQIALVQSTWQQVLPFRDEAAKLFYTKLFELDPSLRKLFTTDIQEQGRKLMAMITVVVNGLNHLDSLMPAIKGLARRHVTYGVTDSHYSTVGVALLWTLGQGLGEAFTPEVEDAWTRAYSVLSHTMKEVAASEAA